MKKDGCKATGMLEWPPGFLGYNTWSNWLIGVTIADQNERERRRVKSFYEECCSPHSEIQENPIDYYQLNVFWQAWLQVAVIKPLQVKLIVAAVLAIFGSARWATILYGLNGPRYVKEKKYEDTYHRTKDAKRR